jgi:hypothetical protein
MIDRALTIVGLALAIIFGAWSLAPDGWPKIPYWLSLIGVMAGVLFCGIGIGMVITTLMPSSSDVPSNVETALFLQYTSNASVPLGKYLKNVK